MKTYDSYKEKKWKIDNRCYQISFYKWLYNNQKLDEISEDNLPKLYSDYYNLIEFKEYNKHKRYYDLLEIGFEGYKDKFENNKDIIDFLMKIKNNKIKVDFNNDESIKKAIHSHFYTKEYEERLSKLLEEGQRKLGIKNIEEVKERLLNNEITINDNELMADLYAFYNIGVLRTSKSMRDTEKFMYLYYYFSSQ